MPGLEPAREIKYDYHSKNFTVMQKADLSIISITTCIYAEVYQQCWQW